jgi:DNA modification methylase
MNAKIIQGDSIEALKTLDSESINCCITSPPYWGLRDYGTATWVGGDNNCEHLDKKTGMSDKNTLGTNGHLPQSNSAVDAGKIQYRDICKKCGATRQDKQLGLELTPQEYVEKMVAVFAEVKRVLRKDGTLWLNLGDTYSAQRWTKKGEETTPAQPMNGMSDTWRAIAPSKESGLPDKNLVGIPWKVAFALQSDGWYLRQDIIWHKPNPMPESVKDRCTKSHEYIFLLSKSANYRFDSEAIKERATGLDPGNKNPTRANGTYHKEGTLSSNLHKIKAMDYRNKRSVWSVTVKRYAESHFATFPKELIEPCVFAGCPEGGTILDPFGGSGTTAEVALENNRNAILIELNPEYIKIAEKRISSFQPKLFV